MAPKGNKGSKGGDPVKTSKSDPPVASRDDASEEAKKKKDAKKKKSANGPATKEPGEGDGECKTTWNQLVGSDGDVDKTLQTSFKKFSAEHLDFDFFNYASKVYTQILKRQLSRKHEDIANRWLNKLMTEHYPDLQSKKTRNIYFTNLLLQMMDGALAGPLLKVPPPGPLPNATVAFQLSAPIDHSRLDNVKDIMLEAKDYLHTSTDGRLYMATKSLEGDVGACAYIGVSVGGDEPQWIKPSGEAADVPEREDLVVLEIEARGDQAAFKGVQPGQSVHAIAAKRKPKADREGLIQFYEKVLGKIREAKTDENLAFDGPQDPLLQKLLLNIQAKARNKEIEQITVETNVMDNDPKLVDMSSLIAMDPADDIWKAAVVEEPSKEVMIQLNNSYPACLVAALLMLLERQRQIIIDQEKKSHEQLVASMKAELLFEIRDGVLGYQEAQRMYNKITTAIKQAEKAAEGWRGKEKVVVGGAQTSEIHQSQTKHVVVGRQLADAQRRLEMARRCALDIDDKMDVMACRISDVQERNKDANKMLQNDAIRWSKHICQMKADIKAQERQIQNMHNTLGTLQRKESCLY